MPPPALPCGRSPGSNALARPPAPPRPRAAAVPPPPPSRAPLQLGPGRPAFPGAPPRRAVVVVQPRQAPRGPLLLGPGNLAPSYADAQRARTRFPEVVRALYTAPAAAFTPTASQYKRIAERIEETFGRYNGHQLRAGFLPLRVDAHPDGRVRLVFVFTEAPAGTLKPDAKPQQPGYMTTMVFAPEVDPRWGWRGEPIVKYDPDPAWFLFRDVRWALPDGVQTAKTFHQTAEEAVDASGFKQPAKVREVRDQHWRTVARLLHHRRPVAFEVLDEYPALAQFYAQNLAAAKTVAELLAERDVRDNPDDPDITVHWSVEQGLLLYTRGKESKIIAAIRAVRGRGMGFKWSGSLGAWYRPQSVGVSESTVNIDYVVRALREQGMVVAVERGETKVLGEANARRQGHKFWRAEGYAERAERGLERADERIARADDIRRDLPVGAPTARADRAEARADKAEAKAIEHTAYVEHAAGAAQNLAATAASYDTTAEITRKQAEKRADAFGQLFVRKVKGLTGAVKLDSFKKDNLSEYSLSWALSYPPSANVSATVSFDGRTVQVWSRDGERTKESKETLLREEVTRFSPEAVLDMAVAVLPKYTATAATVAPTDPNVFTVELSQYARKRAVVLAKAMGLEKVYVPTAGLSWGSWRNFEISQGEGSRNVEWYLLPIKGRAGLHFTLDRSLRRHTYQVADTPMGAVDLDFTGMTIAEAWELLLAGIRAIITSTPLVLPKPAKAPRATKARALPVPPPPPGVTLVAPLPRDATDAAARERALALSADLAPVVAQARARREAIRGRAEEAHPVILQAARAAGHAHGFYPTPPTLADALVSMAEVSANDRVLEPSVGLGALVDPLLAQGATVTAYEVQPDRAAYLRAAYADDPVEVHTGDFLAAPAVPRYDRVVMNPPFAIEGRQTTDAEHVTHALGFVRPGGRLVALMSPGSTEPSNARRKALHAALAGWHVTWTPVDPGRFRISGTDTPTVILVADRVKANRGHTRPIAARKGNGRVPAPAGRFVVTLAGRPVSTVYPEQAGKLSDLDYERAVSAANHQLGLARQRGHHVGEEVLCVWQGPATRYGGPRGVTFARGHVVARYRVYP